jgi:MFS family permease
MAETDPAAGLVVTPEQIVARERTIRPRAGLVALAAAVLTIVANIVQNATLADRPGVNEIDALRSAAGEPIGRPGLGTDQVLYLHDHAAGLLFGALLQALVSLLTGVVLLVLLRSALDRGGRAPRLTRPLIFVGAGTAALGSLLLSVALVINAANFASSSDHGTTAAHDATHGGGLLVAGTLLGLLGLFALAAAFVMVSLAAMRAGLLTRFVGVLGAIVGVLQILGPLSTGSFIVTAFWLAMVGVLLLGRWPSGMPPAWETGELRAWPSQQEIREQRERARAERGRGGGGGGNGTGTPATVTGPQGDGPSPATAARKKRKRRS